MDTMSQYTYIVIKYIHCLKIHTMSQNTCIVTKYIQCHKIHSSQYTLSQNTSIITLPQKYIHYHRSTYIITKVHTLSQKKTHCRTMANLHLPYPVLRRDHFNMLLKVSYKLFFYFKFKF